MNEEQRRYLAHIGESDTEEILIKRTGWEAINLPTHAHEKFQIIYTLSGTLHIKIGSNNYFVPERHLAWIPSRTKHKVSSNSRQVSLTVFYIHQSAHRKRTGSQSAVLHLGSSPPDR